MIIVVKVVFHENNKYYPQVFLERIPILIMNKTKMLYYNRIDVSEGINVNNTSESKECSLGHYWYFLNKGFKIQPNVSNGCHYLLMMSMSLSNNVILNIKSADYPCIISSNSKSEVINLMQNIDLTETSGTL